MYPDCFGNSGSSICSGVRSSYGIRLNRWRMQLSRARLFIVRFNDIPRGLFDVGKLEHLVFGTRVVDPFLARRQVHWTEFPSLRRLIQAILKSSFLFFVADRKPVFDEDDSWTEPTSARMRDRNGETRGIPIRRNIPLPVPRLPGCTNCDQTAPFRRPPASAEQIVENTTVFVPARWVWPARQLGILGDGGIQ